MKTITEIEKEITKKINNPDTIDGVDLLSYGLKLEAIKWIKYLEKNFGNEKKIEFIKHFFNITGEDLENE